MQPTTVLLAIMPRRSGRAALSTLRDGQRVVEPMPPNFALFDATLPDVVRLVAAMVQARDAIARDGGYRALLRETIDPAADFSA